ncbi:MAG: retron system putative HNH endonuclease [Caldilineaceae bacterium]
MMKFPRPPQPDFLREKYKKWGHEHKSRRDADPSASFQWKTYFGQRVNVLIMQAFGKLAEHCAFCDGYPLGPTSLQTIEHFRPVSHYPRLAYVWHNLFPCCDRCQNTKRNRFDRRLLKPDADDYIFEHYFLVNYKTGEIEVNPTVSEIDQHRAQITIELYGLNEHGRPQSRLLEYRKFQYLSVNDNYTLDDFSYRFFLI